ncbi:serine-tRNA ligase (SARS1) [Vairimorpha necatrix]|uniref:serine--tRNA ligase n=1 Tax=Vairimorpha necatrix TaxID=6039 RepID=A0AAX4JGM0_9MICR
MIDINLIRDPQTREKVIESEKRRFKDTSKISEIYEKDKLRIKLNFELDNINRKKNELNKKISKVFKENKTNGKELSQEYVRELKEEENKSKDLEIELVKTEKEINTLLKSVGNIIDDSVIISKNEEDNGLIREYRTKREVKNYKNYTDLMSKYTHSVSGSKIIGHRGYFLSGQIARLGMALSQYAIDFLEENDYTFIQTPVMMRKEVMSRTAQLSDFDEQLYKVEDDLYLIATSEQPLSALHMDERLTDSDLPKKYCGQSLCFRKEAGAHGKDNSGIFRVHQFEKIEQFVICKPEESKEYFDKMISLSEEFYKSLDISYNVVSIVSGEFNDAASIKYDLEAFFPNANKFRELVSCSNCTDYQSRELEVRYGILKENNKKVYVHMLNATLCAVQRTLCCIVENYQEENKIIVPEVLRKYTKFDEIELN